MRLEFESERLKFSPLSDDDLELAITIWTDPVGTRFNGGVLTKERVIADHHKTMRRCANGSIGVWTVTTKAGNEKVGTVLLLPMPIEESDTNWDLVAGDKFPNCNIEIGYFFVRPAWGKGYATESCKRLLQFAFEETPLEEIFAVIEEGNEGSHNVLLKCGLQPIGTVRAYAMQLPGFRISKNLWESARLE